MEFIRIDEDITLSKTNHSDCDAMVEHLQDKEIYNQTLQIPYPYTFKDAEYIVKYFQSTTLKYSKLTNWAIRNKDQRLIGIIGFHNGIKSHKEEIGYWLAKTYWGKGIMTKTLRKVCEVAFEEFGLMRITANIFENNFASAKVLEKCNFVLEAPCLRNHYLKNNKLQNGMLYALTNIR